MPEYLDDRPPTAFWFISGVALIWNLIGFVFYLNQVTTTPEQLARAFSPEQVAFMQDIPKWATSAFALAVTTGVLGSLSLLVRKAWAVPLFVISLVAVVVMEINNFVLNDTVAMFGKAVVLIQSAIVIGGILLILFSRYAKGRHWLR